MNPNQLFKSQDDKSSSMFYAGREFAMRTHNNKEMSWSDVRDLIERQRDYLISQLDSYVSGIDSFLAEREQRLLMLEVNTKFNKEE